MRTQTPTSKILLYEGTGFLVIIVLSWVSELSDLPYFIGGVEYIPNWRECYRDAHRDASSNSSDKCQHANDRLHYLENFLRICAWGKKLEHEGEWIPMEEFFERKFQMLTSHGMCLSCAEEMKRRMRMIDAA